MDHATVITPVGCIGIRGVDKDALVSAVEKTQPQALAMDAGSMDCGPWYLGTGEEHCPILDIEWDLEVVLTTAVPKKIPVIIGSAGGSGSRIHVEKTIEMIQTIAAKHGLHFRLAVIYSDVDPSYLMKRATNGVVPDSYSLNDDTPLPVATIKESNVIVGLMGVEPIVDALDDGADVIICGRACDSAVIAAYPVWKGFDRGLAYHMGDIMECGESAAEEIRPTLRALAHNRIPIIGRIEKDCFYLKPAHNDLACTPNSCLMHSFYERTDITHSKLPGGTLNKSESHYVKHDTHTTKIWGSKFDPEPYSVLLEGTRSVGHRAVLVIGVRTPRMIEQLDQILSDVASVAKKRFVDYGAVQIHWHQYGKNGVLGNSELPSNMQPIEVGVVADVVAETQALAMDVAYDIQTRTAFWRYPGRQTTAGNVAVAFSPSVLSGGEVFEFSVYHAVNISDYKDITRREIIEI